jgi:hypothetical protein
LLRDGLTLRDRIALETYGDARAAMALIREVVEDCAPPGSVACEDYLTPEFTVQAEAIVVEYSIPEVQSALAAKLPICACGDFHECFREFPEWSN